MSDEVAELSIHWKAIHDHVRDSRHPDIALAEAIRWTLVHSFGDDIKYQRDAEFHARVHVAKQMLLELVQLRESTS